MTDNSLQPLDPNLSNEFNTLFENWMSEIQDNPHFSQESFTKNENFDHHSKQFLNQVLSTLSTQKIPSLSQDEFKPLFGLWHQLLKDQQVAGFSTKDTAFFIFSLKSALLQSIKESSGLADNTETTDKLQQLLDLLGLLTFEVYTLENDTLIHRQQEQINYLQHNHTEGQFKELIGNSASMQNVYKAIGLILDNDITVLLEGESGTGKDVIANTIHAHSKRQQKPFIVVNCGAIPKDLIESELFGHEKGAFTGADSVKLGKFELAEGGTLFLDEIGELPLDMQVKLLRVLQNREIVRIGGKDTLAVNIRVIAATNKSLKKLVDEGSFRLDLFYRLNVFPIRIPSLRERKEDILPLAHHFLEKYAGEFNIEKPPITSDAKTYLENYHWEGNIRELENMIQRALIISKGSPISTLILEFKPGNQPLQETDVIPLLESSSDSGEIMPLEDLEKNAIIQALNIKRGNILQAAKALHVSRTTFYNKLERYNIDIEELRQKGFK